ncbi:unnamed protein product [Arctia plantaginis]|uniref:Mitochondrial thiamine pyrophosphate carrier n=1 Tax=Arctia plantaginis TaxID=874455 RepID=A0A8S1BRJ2_ARCPL|nr:unnamed protein product [Arctia plantaginis]
MVSLAPMDSHTKTTIFQAGLAGGLAGAFTRAVSQPLDVLKIRFQLQIEPIGKGSKYSSMAQATAAMIREEGIATLWSGHMPAQFLSITYGVIQFSVFEELTNLCRSCDKLYLNHKNWLNFANGSIAATVATVASYPFDTIRTRLIAEQKTKKAYKGSTHAFTAMVKTEGIPALFKGLNPTLGQIAPHAGMQFAVYKIFKDSVFTNIPYFNRKTTDKHKVTTLTANLLSGSISGCVAKTAIYPFDLVKKRLQIQGFQHHRKFFGKQMYCNGLIHCVRLTIAEEGFLALYKGYLPSMLKAMLVTALHFAAYDEIKLQFKKSES